MTPSRLQTELLRYLSRVGPSPAIDAYRHLGISQPVFSRLTRSLGPELLTVGRARSTRYAARRQIEGVGTVIPIYTIRPEGGSLHVARLHGIEPRGFWVEPLDPRFDARFHDDLPYFLHEMRPAGFLGRLIPRRRSDLNLPGDILRWSADDCLRYFVNAGWDLPGDLIVGDPALNAYIAQARGTRVPELGARREDLYPRIATELLKHSTAGCSAGGEQPKFVTRRPDGVCVLVKFSPPLDSDVALRWADLLICEHVAHTVLSEHGFNGCRSEMVSGGERLFLEVERFDRGQGGGRYGYLSLMAIDLEHVGSGLSSWGRTAKALRHGGHCDEAALSTILELELFGGLIGNTDMHLGNVALMASGERIAGVAPVYDMLPMVFAPQSNELVAREFVPSSPTVEHAAAWPRVYPAALDYWTRVVAHPLVSDGFKAIARHCHGAVSALGPAGELLPS